MKKILYSSAFICFAFLFTFSVYPNHWIQPEKTVDKNINLRIVPANSYRRAAYSHSSAMLTVMVISVKSEKMDTLLVKDYPDFKLRNLPAYSKKFNEAIHVPNVADKKEQIVLLYTIVYKSKESVLKVPRVNFIQKGTTNDDFLINI